MMFNRLGTSNFRRPTINNAIRKPSYNNTNNFFLPKFNFSTAVEGKDHNNAINISDFSVEHATGLEKAEILSALKGEKLFGESILTGAFGTLEKPVKVPSAFSSRLVGCVGGDGENGHDLLWHEVKEGKPLICAECGQVFQLVKRPLPPGVTEEQLHHH